MIKLLLGFATGGWGWVVAAAKWALDNWKLVGTLLLVLAIFVAGVLFERGRWEKKWAARDAEESLVEAEHIRVVQEIDGVIDAIEEKARGEKATRGITYAKIDEEVARYVLHHSLPAPPGVCSADTDIGDDGLLLIERTRAARFSGAH